MKATSLACAAFLTAAAASSAAVPPDLEDSARQLAAFPASRGHEEESVRLARFFDLYWLTGLRASPEWATYVGAAGFDDRLSDLSPATIALSRRLTQLELTAISSLDRARLRPQDQLNYDLALGRIREEIEGERFPGELLQVGPLGGVHQTLTNLLPAMPAATAGDFAKMLTRMRAYPVRVEQSMALLAQGLKTGVTAPRVTLRDVPDQVAALLTDDPLRSPVLEPFRELPSSIPAAEQERLRQEASRIYRDQIAPVLRKLHRYLKDVYVPGARESIAMSALPDGKAWYAFQLRSFTTTDRSPEEIHQLGLSEVQRIRRQMDALIASTGFKGSFAEFCTFLRTDPRFFYDKPEDLVAGYRDIAKRIDPGLIKLFGRLPRLPYGVKAMGDAAAKSAPAGYSNSGSLAAGRAGWFLVNTYDLKSRPRWAMEALTLHEAVPGHQLQYALVEELGELPAWRRWDIYPAFSEGWAFYAESLGNELGLYQDPYSKFGELTNQVWRAIRMVVDTGLHTMGWTRQQAIDYYTANSAKPALEITAEVDRIISQPGTVPAYKLGELKIRELRAFAEKELGSRFDIRAFHDRVLANGQLPLDLLDKSIREWVAARRRSAAKGLGSAGTFG